MVAFAVARVHARPGQSRRIDHLHLGKLLKTGGCASPKRTTQPARQCHSSAFARQAGLPSCELSGDRPFGLDVNADVAKRQ
jgi:hypothetical protein